MQRKNTKSVYCKHYKHVIYQLIQVIVQKSQRVYERTNIFTMSLMSIDLDVTINSTLLMVIIIDSYKVKKQS